MADQTPADLRQVNPLVDPYGYLGFVQNPDSSSVTRDFEYPKTPVSVYDGSSCLLVKDISINPSNNTGARVFLPKEALESSPGKKLPLLIYFHGGGFVMCNAESQMFDAAYESLTTVIPVVLVSVAYRNAPEHRLPAAYEDCLEALHWIKNSRDEWLTKYADLSNSFLMGSSSGGNIAYHVGLSASSCADDLKPLSIKGVILHHPFFGGNKRTDSELRAVNDMLLPPCVSDKMWELALPVGVDRDHAYCNPVLNVKPGEFDGIKALGWNILVAGCDGDPLFDRQAELVKVLENEGVHVVPKFVQGGYHAVEIFEPPKLKVFCQVLKEFVTSVVSKD